MQKLDVWIFRQCDVSQHCDDVLISMFEQLQGYDVQMHIEDASRTDVTREPDRSVSDLQWLGSVHESRKDSFVVLISGYCQTIATSVQKPIDEIMASSFDVALLNAWGEDCDNMKLGVFQVEKVISTAAMIISPSLAKIVRTLGQFPDGTLFNNTQPFRAEVLAAVNRGTIRCIDYFPMVFEIQPKFTGYWEGRCLPKTRDWDSLTTFLLFVAVVALIIVIIVILYSWLGLTQPRRTNAEKIRSRPSSPMSSPPPAIEDVEPPPQVMGEQAVANSAAVIVGATAR